MNEFLILQCGLNEQIYLGIGIVLGALLGSLFTLIINYTFKKNQAELESEDEK
jgi:hypothetical protein